MFENVKNAFERKSLAKNLAAVVAATQSPAGFISLDIKHAEKLVAADSTLVEAAPSTDGKTQAVRATQAGIDAVNNAPPAVSKPRISAPTGSFAVESGIPMPAINRGGTRTSAYPFDQLEVGQSFFIPVTDAVPNPAKTYASAVSSATRRHKASTPPRVFTVRGNEDQFPGQADTGVKGARVWRVEPSTATPKQASGEDSTATH